VADGTDLATAILDVPVQLAKRLEHMNSSPERLRRDRRPGRDSGAQQRQPSHPPLVNDCARLNKSRQKRPSDLQAHE
jgi:hypothetical protein